ncbi:hypothetical protein IWQ47_003675 [Aquimarina sp. EL_43]|uniref:tail fiber protein n=1 Tax=unclassified Aquimarina TaxID=2627091 RepID=UPI001A2A199A|nr:MULTISPECIES: tail fiber protein [unclassified Aquimarina]MBG6132353.1 hypothetical protein [Aquimarina sp. EL_35]MBG6152484.1 hypothetical protein [Aquimarina sp. EL_32]MBG6170589.1 hypothetical protein [Aquimarina sp. EL_43]
MKKSIFLSVSLVLISFISTAQTNTFPTTGNVGIGTTTPDQALVVKGSISFDYGDTKSYNGFRRNGAKTEYYNIITGVNTNVIHEFTGANRTIMSLTQGGNVGIGTTNPQEKLHVKGNLLIDAFQNGGGAKGVFFREGFSTSNKYNLSILTHHDGDNTPDALDINAYDGVYFNTGSNDRNPRMVILGDGNVGIGTTIPDSKLAVNGKIHAKEVKVDLTGWPDYVFENNYNLPSLQEVEHHIAEEGHLPNIPSASEVEKNGIQLGEMNARLLQKIEELTLYMIAQNKKTEQLQREIELLKQKNIELEKK